MKKSIFTALFAILTIASLAQERVVRVHSGGREVYSTSTSGTNRMYFGGTQAFISHNGELWQTALSSIDSLTFAFATQDPDDDTVAIDTVGIVITWNGDDVDIVNSMSNSGVAITANGGHVTIVAAADSADLTYVLRGSSSNGSLTVTTDKKLILYLDNLQLTNSSGPAITVGTDHRALLYLSGISTLSDGANNTDKAALQFRGKLRIQGNGELNVSGLARHAIQSSGPAYIEGGTTHVLTAVQDGLNVDDFIMSGGTLTVTSSGDGVDGDEGYIDISGGTLTINCAADDVKGLSCDSTLTIRGGNVNVTVGGDQSKAIKTKSNMRITGGTVTVNANGSVVLESAGSGYEPSYCTGIKVNGNLYIQGGTTTVVCPTSNLGGKAISADGNITVTDGIIDLTATGACNKYLDADGVYDSYSSTCLKSDAAITINGGTLTLTAGGRAISCDSNYTQNGGSVTTSTSSNGFTTIGTGRSCTDGFAPACLKSDGNLLFTQGSFSASSTGTGGRGIVADGTMTFGLPNADDSLLTLYVTTSGAAVNATSGGGGPWGGGGSDAWKGLPKGIKIGDDIIINSGYVQSFCSQTSGDPTGEAIETKDSLTINGGFVEANAYDDAINAASHIQINGGAVWAYARGNDGLDCNGTYIHITGGTILAYGSECGVDDNADNGGTHLYISNATMVVVGGNMGAIEGTPSLTGQKYLVLSSGSGGWGGGGSGGLTLARNGFCIKSGSTEVLTFRMPNISTGDSGFETPDAKRVSGVFVTTPSIQSGTYTYYTSPTITGGSNWHGLYTGATVTTSGSGTSTTAR